LKNPRKPYTKHKKNEAKIKNEVKNEKGDTSTKEEITNNVNEINNNIPPTGNGEENESQSISLASSVDNSINADSSVSMNEKINQIVTDNNNIENINSQKSNTVPHAPKKTLLPPKSLKRPQRRNLKRSKFNMEGTRILIL